MTTRLERLGVKSHKYRASKVTYLEMDNKLVCPLCLKHKTKWHVHHFVSPTDGGKETKYNRTVLCAMCHRMLHDGEPEEGRAVWERLHFFLLARYGYVGLNARLENPLVLTGIGMTLNTARLVHLGLKRTGMERYLESFGGALDAGLRQKILDVLTKYHLLEQIWTKD